MSTQNTYVVVRALQHDGTKYAINVQFPEDRATVEELRQLLANGAIKVFVQPQMFVAPEPAPQARSLKDVISGDDDRTERVGEGETKNDQQGEAVQDPLDDTEPEAAATTVQPAATTRSSRKK